MTNKTIILGNGLSALVWAAYHPDSIIIGPGKPGGMAKDMKAPFFLHQHPATQKLLEKLGLGTSTRLIKVGYAYLTGDSVRVCDTPPHNFRAHYYRHSRCLDKDAPLMPDSVMNEGIGHFKAYSISKEEFINTLIEYVTVNGTILINDKVKKIIPRGDVIDIYGGKVDIISDYDIISTIPFSILISLLSDRSYIEINPLDTLTKIFLKANKQLEEIMGYDFIYFAPHPNKSDIPFHISNITRMNNNRETGKSFFEYTFRGGNQKIDEIATELMNIYGRDSISIHPSMGIRRDVKMQEYFGIQLLGRGAQWDHSIKMQDVIMEAQEGI